MDFDEYFRTWLAEALNTTVPDSVNAFCFNLYQSPSDEFPFSIELIGSPFFDAEDDDWACEDIWQAMPRTIAIPEEFSSRLWEKCLERVKALVLKILQDDSSGRILRNGEGVGVGFVNGDLHIVWRK